MRKVISVILGVVTGFIIIFIGDATTHALYPVPPGLDYANREQVRAFVDSVPMVVKIIMVVFWLGSAFLGAMLASRINRNDWKRTSIITGSILLAAALLNLAMVPHPAWMWLVAILGYIPTAFFAGWLVKPKTTII